MKVLGLREHTAGLRALQAATLLGMGCAPSKAGSQELPYTVQVIAWLPQALEEQRKSYRREAGRHEVLFCVERWRVDSVVGGYQRIIIERTRREAVGSAHSVANAGQRCLGPNGDRLPMIHTHSDGNCQLSPTDLTMVAARAATFDGVQCGGQHFVWAFAWQVKAIVASIYLNEQRAAMRP